MSGLRINNASLNTSDYLTARGDDAVFLIDSEGATEADKLPIKLIGNAFVEGSYDKVTWSNPVLSDHSYIRFSTDGTGTNYLVFDVSYNSDSADLHKPLTIGSPSNGLQLDYSNQILTLDWDGVVSLEDIGDFPSGATNEVFVKIAGGYDFIILPHSYLTDLNTDTDYVHLSQAQKDNLIQAATNATNGYMTLEQVTSLEGKADEFTIGSGLTMSAGRELSVDTNSSDLEALTTTYSILLPSSTTVAGRISGAVEGTDYPTGWVLDDTDSIDLQITHGLDKRISSVMVWSTDTEGDRQLYNNAAFSGILAESTNILKIESLATIESPIIIQLVF